MTLQELIDYLTNAQANGLESVWVEQDNGNVLDITDVRLHMQGSYVVIEVSGE